MITAKNLLLLLLAGLAVGVTGLAVTGGRGFAQWLPLSRFAAAAPVQPAPEAGWKPAAGGAAAPEARDAARDEVGVSRRSALVRATETAAASVVSITVTRARVVRNVSPFFNDPFFDLFLYGRGSPGWESVSSIGSGVVVDARGYVVTNSHVIRAADGEQRLEILVHLADGRRVKAEVLGEDRDNDVAVLKVGVKDLPVARLQDKEDNLAGEWVIAIGNPFGYLMSDARPTVTAGVISATNRNFARGSGIRYYNMIQTDAAINPGNSGGALVNALGEVIGINTFIFTGEARDPGFTSIGFAIPIQKTMRVVKELIDYGYIREWTTGLFMNPYLPEAARPEKGVALSEVEPASPGAKAGLAPGDVIYSVAGVEIWDENDIREVFRRFQVGEKVEIRFERAGAKLQTEMVLEEKKKKWLR